MPKVANNTYMTREADGTIRYRLHSTDVVIHHPDGTFTLNSGGWHTVTTKERINRYAPCRVYQQAFEWFVVGRDAALNWDWDHPYPFEDGMRVDAHGVPSERVASA
jgi:hypothetical protein